MSNEIEKKIESAVLDYVKKRHEECEQRIKVLEEQLKEDYADFFVHSGTEMYIECRFRDFYEDIMIVAGCLEGEKIPEYLERERKKLEDSILNSKLRTGPRTVMEAMLENEDMDIKRGFLREIKQIVFKVKNLIGDE